MFGQLKEGKRPVKSPRGGPCLNKGRSPDPHCKVRRFLPQQCPRSKPKSPPLLQTGGEERPLASPISLWDPLPPFQNAADLSRGGLCPPRVGEKKLVQSAIHPGVPSCPSPYCEREAVPQKKKQSQSSRIEICRPWGGRKRELKHKKENLSIKSAIPGGDEQNAQRPKISHTMTNPDV